MDESKSLNIGVVLPHTKLYGGVRRFLELGNFFVSKGHQAFIFTHDGKSPEWFSFNGQILSFEKMRDFKLDALFFTEPSFAPLVAETKSTRKIFYFVRANENLNKIRKKVENVEFFANSTNMVQLAKRKFNIEAFPAIGGLNPDQYVPRKDLGIKQGKPFEILAYGRLAERRKGTKYVVSACERLLKKGYSIHLTLFDTPVTEKMEKAIKEFSTTIPYSFILNHPVEKNQEIFHKADVFVAPEKKAGWANTVVEAMACGIPVIASTSGTMDFLVHEETGLIVSRNSRRIAKAIVRLIENEQLRIDLAEKAVDKVKIFAWNVLGEKILDYLQRKPGIPRRF
ncbi:glycosyltransferase family 4 protein [Marinilabilia sp.]|uniref:glycosyltransferase family 4 protein n=1 Tax=Marinilabilia sp. TaxID=2021252 RepID=UPI0025B8F95C|nr:glycosyltransferase family 4 protein [Marinilabilia sp.]